MEAKQHGRSNERHQISEETTMNAKKERERERERDGLTALVQRRLAAETKPVVVLIWIGREGGRKKGR